MTLEQTFKQIRLASRELAMLTEEKINEVLISLANQVEKDMSSLLAANQKDLDRMSPNDPKYDRLKLTENRLRAIAGDLQKVASLSSPVGNILEKRTLDNGIDLEKIRVPLGVVGIIYEARPNVTFDVFALCLKSGNACILKGGSDAEFSNFLITRIIKDTLDAHNVNQDVIKLLPSGRTSTDDLLNAVGYVDIVIPRGSQNLINYVRENAKVPVIETGAGIVHTYFDLSGDTKKGADIIFNAKTRRVSVCNALDCLIIHEDRLRDLPALVENLALENVLIYADQRANHVLKDHYPEALLEQATEEHFGTEFLDYKISIVTVKGLQDALGHIARYSSMHSEAIIAEDKTTVNSFLRQVDAAVVYANASTAFTDGAQFGLGAEIGISTQKLHARGPMALNELTSYKWVLRGNGTIRES